MNYKQLFRQFVWLTKTPGIGGRIKSKPEDFVVEEVISNGIFGKKECLIFRITKRRWDTVALVKEIAKRTGLCYRDIGFAGSKDKHAIATQYISICDGEDDRSKIENLDIKDVKIEFVGYGKRLRLGSLLGNKFTIIVRDLRVNVSEASARVEKILNEAEEKGAFPNYFGYQRFGEQRANNHEIGKLLLEGKFEEAAILFLGQHCDGTMLGDEARKRFLETRDVDEALEKFPKSLRYERTLLFKFKETQNWKKAFLSLPRQLLRIFIHAYQSYLFNKVLSKRIQAEFSLGEALIGDVVCRVKNGLPIRSRNFEVTKNNVNEVNEKIKKGELMVTGPIFGCKGKLAKGKMGEIEEAVLEEENIELKMFKLRPLGIYPELGGRRELPLAPKDFSYARTGKDSLEFKFFIPRGCYATSVMREIMKDY